MVFIPDERASVWVITTENGLFGIYETELRAKAKAFDLTYGANNIEVTRWHVE